MLRRICCLSLLIVSIGATAGGVDPLGGVAGSLGAVASPRQEQPFRAYLPLTLESTPVQVVETDRGYSYDCYGCYNWVYGYVENITAAPVYSATVGVLVTVLPYCEPQIGYDDCTPYEIVESVLPAFPMTLPGQINPFYYYGLVAKSEYRPQRIFVRSARLSGRQQAVALTVVDWALGEASISGQVRNDSAFTLEQARVVVVSDECRWRTASLDATTLLPGERTAFRIDPFPCVSANLAVLGQGVVLETGD